MDTKKMTLAALIVGIVGLTIGFAAYSTSLTVTSRATVTPDEDLWSMTSTGASCTGGASINVTTSGKDLNASVTNVKFSGPGDSVVCTIPVKNAGGFDPVYLSQVEYGTDCSKVNQNNSYVVNACNGIKMGVTVAGQSVADGSTPNIALAKGASHDIVMTINYESGYTNEAFVVDFNGTFTYVPEVGAQVTPGGSGGTSGTNVCRVVEKSTLTTVDYGVLSVGDKVECGTEYFYIMPDHELAGANTVSMLAAQNIEITESNPKQSSSAGSTEESRYWGSVPNGTFVYNSSSSLAKYVDAYKGTLTSLGVSEDIKVTLASYAQLTDERIGCEERGSCLASFINNGQSWWTGSASDSGEVWRVNFNGGFRRGYTDEGIGVRPVVIIPENQITA